MHTYMKSAGFTTDSTDPADRRSLYDAWQRVFGLFGCSPAYRRSVRGAVPTRQEAVR